MAYRVKPDNPVLLTKPDDFDKVFGIQRGPSEAQQEKKLADFSYTPDWNNLLKPYLEKTKEGFANLYKTLSRDDVMGADLGELGKRLLAYWVAMKTVDDIISDIEASREVVKEGGENAESA